MGSAVDRLLSQQGAPPANFDQGSKVDSVLSSRPSVDDIMGGGQKPFDPNALAPRQVPLDSIPDDPSLLRRLMEMLKEQGLSLAEFGKYVITTPGFFAAAPGIIPSSGKLYDDILRASQGDEDAKLRINRGLEGAALVGSTIAASGAGVALGQAARGLGGGFLRKAAAFLTAESLGGATYGAITPLEDGQTREEEIKHDMIAFPIAGAVLHGLFKGTGKIFKGFFGLGPEAEQAAKNMGKEEANRVGKRVVQIVNEAGDIPPQYEAQVHSEAFTQALREERLLQSTPEEKVTNLYNDLRGGNLGEERNLRIASVVEKMRGKPLTRAEFDAFLKDVAEDGEYMAVRKWGEPPARPTTTATTKLAEEPSAPTEPDFTVEINPPPTRPSGLKKDLGTVSEEALQQEMKDVVPSPAAPVDESAARVQAARETPFPELPDYGNVAKTFAEDGVIPPTPKVSDIPAVTYIDNAIFRNSVLKAAKRARIKIPDIAIDALATGSEATIAKTYLELAKGNKAKADKTLARHKEVLANAKIDIPGGITADPVLEAMAQQVDNPGPMADAAVKDAVADKVVEETPIPDIMDEATKQQAEREAEKIEGPAIRMADNRVISGDELKKMTKKQRSIGQPGFVTSAGRFVDNEEGMELAARSGQIPSYDAESPAGLQEGDLTRNGNFAQDQRPPLTNAGGPTFDPGAGPQVKEGWGGVKDEDLDNIKSATEDFFNSTDGAITQRAAMRIAGAALSGVSFYAAENEDDPRARALLNTVGGLLAVASLMPGSGMKKWLRETKWTYSFIKANDAARVFSDGTMKGIRDYNSFTQQGKVFSKQLEEKLLPVFTDHRVKEAAMYSLDEGPMAPEWHTLTRDQQNEVVANATLNNVIGTMLVTEGVVPDARMFYISQLFRDGATRTLWRDQWKQLGARGMVAQQRQFATLREAMRWATANNQPKPTLDPVKAQASYVVEANRLLANRRLQQAFERTGVLQPYDPAIIAAQGVRDRRDMLRQVRVQNLGGKKMAPDEVATTLERAYNSEGFDWLKALDSAKSQLMRSIMFWAWEHGINVMRGAAALDGTGTAFRQAQKAVAAADPVVMQASKYTDLFQRPDFSPETQNRFDKILQKIGAASPTLKKLGIAFEDFRARGERKLWDRQVPALGLAVWTKEMHEWTKRTGGRYLIGSPEYEAAAHRAGEMANNAMGKIPSLMQDPKMAQVLRLALFSPSWTRGRIYLTANAMGELQKIASGEINPRDASYLGYKLRSVLVGVALTAAASYLLSGKWPTFNPNTQKFYINTGVKDKNGRELGVDLNGWWQDDLKLFNEPFNYIRDRQNPMLREFNTQVSGRDVFGRPIQGTDRLESLIQLTGPPGELAMIAAHTAGSLARGETPTIAGAIRGVSGVGAVGNVSALPKEADAIVAKMAGRVLRQSGLPDDSDRIFELSQLMRRNWSQSGTLYGGEVNSWIAAQRRAYRKTHPISTLYQEGKKALRDLAR